MEDYSFFFKSYSRLKTMNLLFTDKGYKVVSCMLLVP